MLHPEETGELLDVFFGSAGLAVEHGRDGDFFAADLFRNRFEAELFVCFGVEHGEGGGREPVLQGSLWCSWLANRTLVLLDL